MTRRLLICLAVVSALLPAAPAVRADGCASGAPPAWFVAAVYDAELPDDPRGDFKKDVANFERYRALLGDSYCFGAASTTILAFNGFTQDGKTYPSANEYAFKQALRTAGTAANAATNAHMFVFLSSHGFAGPESCPGGRRIGSFAYLATSPLPRVENGELTDCELGTVLNDSFQPDVRMAVFVDCSVCGGFSDSTTAVSGTVPDSGVALSGIVKPGRIVVTGCAITTECFGSDDGGNTFKHINQVLDDCDGWTAPGFPGLQGIDVPQRSLPRDGRCGISEILYAAVDAANRTTLTTGDVNGTQQQYRLKYGFATLAEDILVV